MLKLKPKTQKLLSITGLLAVCIILVAFISISLNGGRNNKVIANDVPKDTDTVVVGKITDNTEKPATPKPDAEIEEDKKVENTQAVTPTDKTNVVVPLTEIKEVKPTSPPTPEIKHDIEDKGDKNVKPTIAPEKPKAQASAKPSAGDTNSKGQTYVPGFGWVDNSGANQGGVSNSKGDINKQVGNMN